jgi:hypothetical protein
MLFFLVLFLKYNFIKGADNVGYCSWLETNLHGVDLCQIDPCCKMVDNECISNDKCSSYLYYDCPSISNCDHRCCQKQIFSNEFYVYFFLIVYMEFILIVNRRFPIVELPQHVFMIGKSF